MKLIDKKYYDEDPTIYNGEKPYEKLENYSFKYEDVKKAVLEFEKTFEMEIYDIDVIQNRFKQIFGDFEE